LLWMAPIYRGRAIARDALGVLVGGVVGGVGVRVCIGDRVDDDRRHWGCRSCYCCNCANIVLGVSLKRHDAHVAAFDVVRRHSWPLLWLALHRKPPG
jgi:hypothetical protein